LRTALRENGDAVQKDVSFYVRIPPDDSHVNHIVGEVLIGLLDSVQSEHCTLLVDPNIRTYRQ